jgi:serine protease Do
VTRRTVKDVEIVAVDPSVDLALLKFKKPEGMELTPLYFGDMDRVRTGEPVFAVGNPFGLERTVSEGIVSHKARLIEGMLLIQTTAPINPGNSGGPLLNMRGEVIGVTNMKLSYFAEGMGFAVPVNSVRDFLKFREAYAYDKDNPNTGYHYLEPPHDGGKEEKKDEEQQEAGKGQA